MANKIILKSGETVPTVDNLEELEPGIDKTTNKLYTKINGQIVSLNDTSWENIQNKPEAFPPSEHTHEIIDIENLESEIEGKMDSPTNNGSSGQYLQRVNSNQGQWVTIPNASGSSNGFMTSTMYNDLYDKMDSPTNTGSSGQFLRRNSSNQGTWTSLPIVDAYGQNGILRSSDYERFINNLPNITTSNGWTRYESAGFNILFKVIPVSNLAVRTPFENIYRSSNTDGFLTTTQRQFGINFSSTPVVFASYNTTSGAPAWVQLNHSGDYTDRFPNVLLLAASARTCTGNLLCLAVGNTGVG